jgi:hypothetical protein
MRLFSSARGALALALFLGASPAAFAASCAPDEVEVGRTADYIDCKDRKEYSACIGKAGAAMKQELSRSCGTAYKDCFRDRNVDISIQVAACLGGALVGCGAGQIACVQVCNLALSGQELAAYHGCTTQVTPCYEQALSNDRARKEACKQ